MRTTLTLDDDVAAQAQDGIPTGRPAFSRDGQRDIAPGLESRRATAQRRAFKMTACDLGNLQPGLCLDNIAELIEHVEGSLHR